MATRKKKPQKKVPASTKPDAERDDDILSMEQAIEMLKTTRSTFYRWLREGQVKGMKTGRQWRFYRADLERFMRGETPKVELPAELTPLITTLEKQLKDAGVTRISSDSDSPIITAINLIIHLGVALRASDIHIEPYENMGELRYRVDGALHTAAQIDAKLFPALVERIKVMCKANVQIKKLPQDGRVVMKIKDSEVDMRISIVPVMFGETVTMRLLDRDAVSISLDHIPLRDAHRQTLIRHIEAPNGLIVVTGPVGSGKTTTLYAILDHLNSPEQKLVSVEHPVEYIIRGVCQIGLHPEEGLTQQRAIRSMMRLDPDVMMIGEIQNQESAQLCHEAALTGHMVLTTLHTADASLGIRRLVDIGIQPFVVADALSLMVSQRLVRKLCTHCSREVTPPADELERARGLAVAGGLIWEDLPKTWRKLVGCKKCRQLGFRGRTCVNEMLEVTTDIRKAIMREASAEELKSIAIGQGMTTLVAEAIMRAAAGETTLQEAMRVQPEA